jgi:hypothetical protein
MLREASLIDPNDVDHDFCRSPTATEASVKHDVFAVREGEGILVPPADGAHQREEAVQSRSNPGTVLDVFQRPVALRGLKVPPVKERIERLQNESLVSRLLFEIPRYLDIAPWPARSWHRIEPFDMRTSSAAVILKAAPHPLPDDRLELGRSLLPDAVASLENIQARIG